MESIRHAGLFVMSGASSTLGKISVMNPMVWFSDPENPEGSITRIQGSNCNYHLKNSFFYHPSEPAVTDSEGTRYYYTSEKAVGWLHREEVILPAGAQDDPEKYGAALIRTDGSWEYRQEGKLHRKTGPAVRKVSDVVKVGNFDVGGSETLEYWENGKRHRIDGPAVISDSGVEYWLYNRQTTEEEVMKLVKSKSGERGLRDFLAKIKAAVRPRQAPKVEEI